MISTTCIATPSALTIGLIIAVGVIAAVSVAVGVWWIVSEAIGSWWGMAGANRSEWQRNERVITDSEGD